ncbi:MAG: aminoacetone oxidase family FAD-binding enzyme [Oscillospiraceae bacterium]
MLLEPNRMLGRKLRITGKGRCNVTNDCDARDSSPPSPATGASCRAPYIGLGPPDTKALFEGLGVALKTERGNRVFPESDKADDIADALAELARKNGVRVLRERARHILTDESGAVCAVATERGEIECANAVICTGGLSYPGTGSTGDGYRMAQELGHTIRTCRPSLVPLESPDKWCREMQGFSLRNVELYAYEDDKLIYKALGEMLFTHFGVSGPLVLSASAHMRRFGECKYRLSIDLKPGLDDKKLDARLLRDFESTTTASSATLRRPGRAYDDTVLVELGIGRHADELGNKAAAGRARVALEAFPRCDIRAETDSGGHRDLRRRGHN